ncbi:MAG: hypothetical protein V1844_23725 [Pseudomonadota bacterium]
MHDDPHFYEFSGSHVNDSPIEVQVCVISSTATPISESAVAVELPIHAMITNAGGGYNRWNDLTGKIHQNL